MIQRSEDDRGPRRRKQNPEDPPKQHKGASVKRCPRDNCCRKLPEFAPKIPSSIFRVRSQRCFPRRVGGGGQLGENLCEQLFATSAARRGNYFSAVLCELVRRGLLPVFGNTKPLIGETHTHDTSRRTMTSQSGSARIAERKSKLQRVLRTMLVCVMPSLRKGRPACLSYVPCAIQVFRMSSEKYPCCAG